MGWGPAGGVVAGDGGKVAGNREYKGGKLYMRYYLILSFSPPVFSVAGNLPTAGDPAPAVPHPTSTPGTPSSPPPQAPAPPATPPPQ
ncbi:hypothetical protein TIFTF001_052853, partial [Ficus carica]